MRILLTVVACLLIISIYIWVDNVYVTKSEAINKALSFYEGATVSNVESKKVFAFEDTGGYMYTWEMDIYYEGELFAKYVVEKKGHGSNRFNVLDLTPYGQNLMDSK